MKGFYETLNHEDEWVYRCLPCGEKYSEETGQEIGYCEDAGDQVCAGCGKKIAKLPEPKKKPYTVNFAMKYLCIGVKAASREEAVSLGYKHLQSIEKRRGVIGLNYRTFSVEAECEE